MICSDTIYAGTGFSEEMRNVLFRLVQTGKFEVYWVGLQHVGHDMIIYDHMFPDLRPMGAFITMVSGVGPPALFGLKGFQRNFDRFAPDLYLMIGDPKNFESFVEAKRQIAFPFMALTTLDGLPIPEDWKEIFDGIDVPLAMTEWALLEFLKAGFDKMAGHIWHGINWQWWATNKNEKFTIRNNYHIDDDTTLFISWDTNQHRKRQDALLRCWKAFKPETKNAKLLLYTDTNCHLGWNLFKLIKQYKVPRETILFPQDIYGRRKHFEQAEPLEFHKQIAQMGDIYVTTTGGEGTGKTTMEALAMQQPVIGTDYAATPEICEKGSILVPTYEGQAGRFRPHDMIGRVERGIVDEEKFVEAMLRLYDNPEERAEMGIQGREWMKGFDYDTQIMPGWLDIFSRINPDVMLMDEVFRRELK